jgi:hypothetical protein
VDDVLSAYRALLETPPPAHLAALRPVGATRLSERELLARLDESGRFRALASPPRARRFPEARLELELVITDTRREGRAPRPVQVAIGPSPGALEHLVATNAARFPGDDLGAVLRASEALHVGAPLAEPLADFHALVALLAALAPDASAVVDFDALRLWPAGWMHEVARSSIPPAPETLFVVHGVVDDAGGAWLHTHGLTRTGTLELELTGVSRAGGPLLMHLLNTTAKMFIERGTPPPGQPFEAARGMPLVWVPWEHGVRVVGQGMGGEQDRDVDHRGPRGLLFVPGERLESAQGYLPQLEDNPVFFVSDMETERAALLARERAPRFVALFARVGLGPGAERWRFLVKLGYEVDGAALASHREHLWFDVHAIEGERVEATCLNRPYGVSRLDEGQRGWHELARLSDFTILCEHGQFGAEHIDALERALEE